MGPYCPFTDSHHSCNPSAQQSLLSRSQKISVSAPVASTRMPRGVHFRFGGGSWSQPWAISPSESVLPFSPPRVVPLVHLGLGVVGDLQRLGVVGVFLLDPVDVGEDGVSLGEFLQGFGLLDAPEPVAHAVEDVPQAAL